jgi:hypothetical protein
MRGCPLTTLHESGEATFWGISDYPRSGLISVDASATVAAGMSYLISQEWFLRAYLMPPHLEAVVYFSSE